jgi:hypothetical protein
MAHMKWLTAALVTVFAGGPACADGCARSLDYILNDLAGELPRPAAAYRTLFDVCAQTLAIVNVHDAYLMKDGGIAILPKKDSVFATANTMAAFCRKFPHNTPHFITRRESQHGLTTGLVVMMRSVNSDSCQKIMDEK